MPTYGISVTLSALLEKLMCHDSKYYLDNKEEKIVFAIN